MIDLHLHLDGSLSEYDFRHFASLQNISLGNEFPKNIYVNNDCKSLEEYLERFDLPLELMQDEYSITLGVQSLLDRLYEKGYIYAEIRFAPLLHLRKGLTQDQVVKAAINGLNKSLENKKDFDANLILCCMRQANKKENLETINIAAKYKEFKVVSVDLAGPEAFHTGDYYQKIFDLANEYKLNITIHGGEATGSDEVIRAIDLLHAKRIGHGVHLELNANNIIKVTSKNIGFEFCPTSNLQTKSLSSYKNVPIKEFLYKGIKVSVNSDNMTVSNTDVYKEFSYLYKELNLSDFEIKTLLYNAVDMSFTSPEEKAKLKQIVDKRFTKFLKEIKN